MNLPAIIATMAFSPIQTARAFRAVFFGAGRGSVVRVAGPISEGYPLFYGSSPRTLRDSLMISASGFNVRYYARRLGRSSEHIGRFLERAEQTAFFADRIELPSLRGVPAEVARPVSEAWGEWWASDMDSRGRAGDAAERASFHDFLVDGEIFFEFDNGLVRPVPSDLVPGETMAPNDFQVEEWILASGKQVPADALIHTAIIRSNWQLRGRSWLARAIPVAYPHMEYRDNAATGIQTISKIAAVYQNETVGSSRRLPTVDGKGGYDAFDTPDGSATASSLDIGVRPMAAGVIEDLEAGKKMEQPGYGPSDAAMKFSADQIPAIAAALGVSETELTGDHVKHNFASLQVAEVRDARTYQEIRQMWYRLYRRPVWRRWLDMSIANGDIKASAVMPFYRALRNPRWAGPRIMSAQPLKDAQAMKEMAGLGLINITQMAASQGENAMRNAEQNAEIMSLFGNAADPDVGDVGEVVADALKEIA